MSRCGLCDQEGQHGGCTKIELESISEPGPILYATWPVDHGYAKSFLLFV